MYAFNLQEEAQMRSAMMNRKRVLAAAVALSALLAAVLLLAVQPAQAWEDGDINGKKIVYNSKYSLSVSDNVLYNEIGGQEFALKRLPVSGDAFWSIAAAYKNNVYLTKGSFEKWKYWSYVYNLKTKKLKKVKTYCDIVAFKGAYAYAAHDYKSDVSANRMDIYKMTASGTLKHVKKLTKYGFSTEIIGKKLYYTSADGISLHKNTLYKAKLNGKGKKKIKTFKASEQYGQAIIFEITAKNCKVANGSGQYLYTYKTKTMTKIS